MVRISVLESVDYEGFPKLPSHGRGPGFESLRAHHLPSPTVFPDLYKTWQFSPDFLETSRGEPRLYPSTAMNVRRTMLIGIATCAVAAGQVSVLTANYDNARTNSNLGETALTPQTVAPATFGKLFTMPVDGQVYAQPLYVPNVNVAGRGRNNLVLVATMHNTLYAFDADHADVAVWQINFGSSVASVNYGFRDAFPEVGILSTPAVNAATGIIYCVSDHFHDGLYEYRLHAVDIATGLEQAGSPVSIKGTVPGSGDESDGITATFEPFQHLQRPGLLVLSGAVFLAFGSHADANPYHGWLFSYDAANIQHLNGVFNTTPNAARGAIWQSGRGLAGDPAGFLYASTGNGVFDGKTSLSDSVLKIDTRSGLKLDSFFSPDDNQSLDAADNDLGSGGTILIPGTTGLIAGGKDGTTYLLDTTNLGGQTTGNITARQSFVSANNGIYGMAIWPRGGSTSLYVQEGNSQVSAYFMHNGVFSTQPLASALTTGTAYEGLAVSANGAQAGSGIVWVTFADADRIGVGGALAAFDATSLTQLWNSRIFPEDDLGNFAKFAAPTVANGKVYVSTFSNGVGVYGLTARSTVTSPLIGLVANAASYSGGAVSAGELLTLFGNHFGDTSVTTPAFNADGSIASALKGTQVFFDGVAAPLLYTTNGQLGAIVPFQVTGQATTAVQVSIEGNLSQKVNLSIVAAVPGLFTSDQSGFGQGAILNQDYSINSAAQPAAPGSIVMLYGTGAGPVTPGDIDGAIATEVSELKSDVKVWIGGVAAEVLYAGSAPSLVEGVFQVNVKIPASAPVGAEIPISLLIDGVSAQTGVTLAVK
jgi:uncharacterized protein (TIGR03437 family)